MSSQEQNSQEQGCREGETDPAPERRSRTFLKPDGWYFMTRERVNVGPFATEDLAQRGVADYAGFSMDADKVYLDWIDIVPDESGIAAAAGSNATQPVPVRVRPGDVFDRRRGDDAPAAVRTARLFEGAGGWYFATREGGSVGPFPSRADAERGVIDYISQVLL